MSREHWAEQSSRGGRGPLAPSNPECWPAGATQQRVGFPPQTFRGVGGVDCANKKAFTSEPLEEEEEEEEEEEGLYLRRETRERVQTKEEKEEGLYLQRSLHWSPMVHAPRAHSESCVHSGARHAVGSSDRFDSGGSFLSCFGRVVREMHDML